MGSYGVQFKNGANEIMIDGVYSNYFFQTNDSVLTVWRQFESGYMGYADVSIPSSDTLPIVAVKALTGNPVYVYNFIIEGTLVTGVRLVTVNSAGTVSYAVYNKEISTPDDDYGLVIKNAKGTTVFYSWNVPLKSTFASLATIAVGPIPDFEEGEFWTDDRSMTPYDISVQDADNNYFVVIPVDTYPFMDTVVAKSRDGYSAGGNPYYWFKFGRYFPGISKINSTTVRIGLYAPVFGKDHFRNDLVNTYGFSLSYVVLEVYGGS